MTRTLKQRIESFLFLKLKMLDLAFSDVKPHTLDTLRPFFIPISVCVATLQEGNTLSYLGDAVAQTD